MAIVGTHCILELYDCPPSLLDNLEFVRNALVEAADEGLSLLLKHVTYRFHPQGVTALGLLAESHISIHTWPEHGYVGSDMFTCGNTADPKRACMYLVGAFEAGRYDLIEMPRGGGAPPNARLQPNLVSSGSTLATAHAANELFDG